MLFYALVALVWARVFYVMVDTHQPVQIGALLLLGVLNSAVLFGVRQFIRWRYRRKHTVFVEFASPR